MGAIEGAPTGLIPEALQGYAAGAVEATALEAACLVGGKTTLRYVAILPIFPISAFGWLYTYRKRLRANELQPSTEHLQQA